MTDKQKNGIKQTFGKSLNKTEKIIIESVLGKEWWKIISTFTVEEVAKLVVLATNKQSKHYENKIKELEKEIKMLENRKIWLSEKDREINQLKSQLKGQTERLVKDQHKNLTEIQHETNNKWRKKIEDRINYLKEGIKAFRENNIDGQWNKEIEEFKHKKEELKSLLESEKEKIVPNEDSSISGLTGRYHSENSKRKILLVLCWE